MSTGSSDLAGFVFVVTGGRSGIGRAVVGGLLERGASVASLDVSPPAGADGDRWLELVCDVTDQASVEQGLAAAAERFGGLDGAVQSAGVTADGVLWKMSEERWQHVLDVNLSGAFRVLKALTPYLRERGRGAIVNVASINGERGKFGQANYAASKGGLIALTKTAARELGAFGIRVNAVAPGLVRTPMTEGLDEAMVAKATEESALKRVAEPEDIADAVIFLLSDDARQITGVTLRVDGGQYM